MADDIDIEEHDVLDNPAIRNMFPDITVLKEEIRNFESGQESVENTPLEKKSEDTSKVIDNKLELNRLEPVRSLICEIDDEDDVVEIIDEPEVKISSNKIILGTKPSRALACEEDIFESHVKSYDVNVVLHDMKSYLISSGRYCKQCLILFPTKVGLDNHNQSSHTPVIKNSVVKNKTHNIRNKCIKCNIQYCSNSSLCRHNRKFHSSLVRVRRIRVKNSTQNLNHLKRPNLNKCFHCKKRFPTQNSLIEHLYIVLQAENYVVCKVCNKTFINVEQLNEHIKLSHEKSVVLLKNNAAQLKYETPEINISYRKLNSNKLRTEGNCSVPEKTKSPVSHGSWYYRCHICGYYFTQTVSLIAHLASKHMVITKTENIEKQKFVGACKFCSRTINDLQSYNKHLSMSHRNEINYKSTNHTATQSEMSDHNSEMKINQSTKMIVEEKYDETTTERLVLKSALFKCLKCDIHFLTSELARNHVEHMEMLINWKCLKCKYIFKKEDEKMHEEQHKHSEKFIVHELCPTTSTPVLYSCVKCSVHFDEEGFLKHYSICEKEIRNSVFCIICDILIDMSISKSHRSEHVSKSLKQTDFLIVNSDILVTSAVRNKHEKDISGTNSGPLKRKSEEKSNIPQKKDKRFNDLLSVTYCHTCKCFLTNIDECEIHIKGFCRHIEKYICRICGLIMTAKSYTTVHKDVHNLFKNVKLKDFIFHDINSCEQICPPIPEYLKCESCDIYLISKDALFSHVCSETDYLTCHLCNINLSEDAFKLHMLFHNYSKNNFQGRMNSNIEETQPEPKEKGRLSTRIQLKPLKIVLNKIDTNDIMPNKKPSRITSDLYSKCVESSIQLQTNNVRDSSQNSIKVNPRTEVLSQTKEKNQAKLKSQTKVKKQTKVQSHTKRNKQTKVDSQSKVKSQSSKTKKNLAQMKTNDYHSPLIKQSKSSKTVNIDGVLFKCSGCLTTVDTYDKVIEHCQGHYCNEEEDNDTIECKICGLSLDKTCFSNHEEIHLRCSTKDYFTIVTFDVFYFTSENRIWTEHVFGIFSQEQRAMLIRESIYKHECRIKMEVIQNGPADLTVYKCDKCRSFINEATLYNHAENSCFKLRRHPCSTCGLPFNSSASCVEHEKVHEKPNIDSNSFRIVTFNKEEDKVLNKLLYSRSQYYVLYQCRNCAVAVEKSQTKNHECCKRNLKTCLTCGLLIRNVDFDIHILRHKELSNIIQNSTIKVVLFGETVKNVGTYPETTMSPSFSGTVHDYTFYSCSKCEVCFKLDLNLDKHTCCFGLNRLKCSICKLYFLKSKLKQHIKLHETDPDFLRQNIRVIKFNPPETISKALTDAGSNHNCEIVRSPPNNENGRICNGPKIDEKHASIYKCLCGLHFLNHISVISHYKMCDPKTRVAKQKCAKCDLLFTAEVLFNHLIMHHGNKAQIYKFNILDITKDNFVYKCIKCSLHFVKLNDINEHFKMCNGTAQGKDCIFCNIRFESDSFLSHNCNNVENVNAIVEVVDLDEPLVSKRAMSQEMQTEAPMKDSDVSVNDVALEQISRINDCNASASIDVDDSNESSTSNLVAINEHKNTSEQSQKDLNVLNTTETILTHKTINNSENDNVSIEVIELFTHKTDAYDISQKQCVPNPVCEFNKDIHSEKIPSQMSKQNLTQSIPVVSSCSVPPHEIKQKNISSLDACESSIGARAFDDAENSKQANSAEWHRYSCDKKAQNGYQNYDSHFRNNQKFRNSHKFQNNYQTPRQPFHSHHKFPDHRQFPNNQQFQNKQRFQNNQQFHTNRQFQNSEHFQNNQQFQNYQPFQNNQFQFTHNTSRMPHWRNGTGRNGRSMEIFRHPFPKYHQTQGRP